MKKILLLLSFCAAVEILYAQSPLKIAYTNADSIVLSLPETQGKLKILESYTKQLSTQAENKQRELQQKYQDYQTNARDWIPEIVKEKERELQKLDRELAEFQQRAQRQIQEKQGKEFAPLYKKVKEAIAEIAKASGYTYVIQQEPVSGFPLLYAEETYDITDVVIEKLGGKK